MRQEDWPEGGHTAGLAADANGVFHPLWVDNRTGIHQIWTASITVDGTPSDPDTAINGLHDVGTQVEVQVINTAFDPATHQATAELRLKNISEKPIDGPIKVHLGSLVSQRGIPTVLNAQGKPSPCLIVDVTGLDNNQLKPKATSTPHKVAFRLDQIAPELQKKELKEMLVSFDAKVMAQSAAPEPDKKE
jgi:hypothetical protein